MLHGVFFIETTFLDKNLSQSVTSFGKVWSLIIQDYGLSKRAKLKRTISNLIYYLQGTDWYFCSFFAKRFYHHYFQHLRDNLDLTAEFNLTSLEFFDRGHNFFSNQDHYSDFNTLLRVVALRVKFNYIQLFNNMQCQNLIRIKQTGNIIVR